MPESPKECIRRKGNAAVIETGGGAVALENGGRF